MIVKNKFEMSGGAMSIENIKRLPDLNEIYDFIQMNQEIINPEIYFTRNTVNEEEFFASKKIPDTEIFLICKTISHFSPENKGIPSEIVAVENGKVIFKVVGEKVVTGDIKSRWLDMFR